MVSFLIFSDWYNTGDTVIHLKDGTAVRGLLLEKNSEEYNIQVMEVFRGIRAGEELRLRQEEVSRTEDIRSWVMDIYHVRWYLAGLAGLAVAVMAWRWYDRSEIREWMQNTWGFSKMLVPLLFGGVFLVGFIEKLLPQGQIAGLVGDNSLLSNLIASVVGAFFYFATLTEIPIIQALRENGMHQGPALALLLAGPALSLPSMLVIRKVMGNAKAAVFIGLVVALSTVVGMVFGSLA